MLKNQRAVATSRKKLQDLQVYLNELADRGGADADDCQATTEESMAVRQLMSEIEAEIDEFESNWNSKPNKLDVASLHELPPAVVRARIAAGLTHADLASRCDLSEGAIQRYEKEDYRTAGQARLERIVDAIGIPMIIHHLEPARNSNATKQLTDEAIFQLSLPRDLAERLHAPPGSTISLADVADLLRDVALQKIGVLEHGAVGETP